MIKKLRIHTLLHVPFEGLGCIEDWIILNGHSVSYTNFFEQYKLPNLNDFDWLIVMGGPMGVYDEAIFPWLFQEKEFIRQAIRSKKTIIGICLGSQLIAEVLGAKVYPNKQKEIGWFNIKQSDAGKNHPLCKNFEPQFTVFHWHGDTFDLPDGCVRLFQSDACLNQAFLFNNKVLGLQFHLEVTLTSLSEMVKNGKNELVEGDTIQSETQILELTNYFEANNRIMFRLLDYFTQ